MVTCSICVWQQSSEATKHGVLGGACAQQRAAVASARASVIGNLIFSLAMKNRGEL